MELTYPKDVQAFADEIRSFVRAHLPPAVKQDVLHHRRVSPDDQKAWQRTLAEHGYATPGWPKEYGGAGWNTLQRHIYDQVMAEEGAPPSIAFGEVMLAPVLFAVGNPEQKAHYLPRIRTLEYYFCQGFSEPGSGSDLASLKTRAIDDGDHWVLNGQKIWTSLAHLANMIFCLVRTDTQVKPQEGITMLIFPMSLPGITVRPIITIDGSHVVNEVFFDNVRVPKFGQIGQVNKGWDYAKLLLIHERTTIARIGQSKRELQHLKSMAGAVQADGSSLMASQPFREKIAALEIELLSLEITALRVISEIENGRAPGVEANLLKIKGSEIQQRLTEMLLETVGPYGLPFDPQRGLIDTNLPPIGPEDAASLGPNYLMTRVVSIYGGSNEIQRNIVAKSLGL